MASIVKRGKKYAVVYYEGEGKKRHQVWESGLSYTAAKARKAQLEYEISQHTHIMRSSLSVADFMQEFLRKYGEKKWVASTYKNNVAMLENYVLPYLGEKKLQDVRVKTVDDYYYFLENEAEPVANMGQPRRKHVTTAVIRDVHENVTLCMEFGCALGICGQEPLPARHAAGTQGKKAQGAHALTAPEGT